MHILGVTSLQTNYIWIILNYTNECIVVDPGEGIIVLKILKKYQLILKAILLTHNHNDHTAGTNILIQHFPKAIIYGPSETLNNGTNAVVSEGDNFTILGKKFSVFSFPGHTKNHIGFYHNSCLFCGDTIFSAGCGSVKPELIQNMYQSLLKIQKFPDNTSIYCGHEYTLSNINFAISILPENKIFIDYRNQVIKLLKNKKPTIPTILSLELKINPFLLCKNKNIQQSLQFFPKKEEEWLIFKELRRRKDLFKK